MFDQTVMRIFDDVCLAAGCRLVEGVTLYQQVRELDGLDDNRPQPSARPPRSPPPAYTSCLPSPSPSPSPSPDIQLEISQIRSRDTPYSEEIAQLRAAEERWRNIQIDLAREREHLARRKREWLQRNPPAPPPPSPAESSSEEEELPAGPPPPPARLPRSPPSPLPKFLQDQIDLFRGGVQLEDIAPSPVVTMHNLRRRLL